MVMIDDLLLRQEKHRLAISHELSHLFRIGTGSTAPTVEEEEALANSDADKLRFDFGKTIRHINSKDYPEDIASV